MTATLKWILAALWTAFIVYALSSEPSGIPRFPWLAAPGVDKVIHAILFGVEAILLFWSFERKPSAAILVGVVVWCAAFGGVMELVQLFWVEGRTGSIPDLLADAFGAIVVAIFVVMKRK